MNNLPENSLPTVGVTANYTPARIPAFRGNPLIEALPPSASEDEIISSLACLPEFSKEQQTWSTAERMHMVGTLQNFMLPMTAHISLCFGLDRMMRNGYVGRAPRTEAHSAIVQALYERQKLGNGFLQSSTQLTPQLSSSLIGVSGMGKTTTTRRWSAQFHEAIFHPQYNIYQIPVLHIEMPSNGTIRALATSIFHAIDNLIPGSNFTRLYTRGKPTDDELIINATQLMNMHYVGLLICDEIQNLANAPKNSQVLMTKLVSMCNVMKVPILFIGTNKAAKVLSVDLRQARRATGEGIGTWNRMLPVGHGGNGEWETFINLLWEYQWLKRPAPLTDELRELVEDLCQGVIGLTIKFFSCVQIRAMLDDSETITAETMLQVYEDEFQLVKPMLEALRSGKLELLAKYDDIAPLDFEDHVEQVRARIRAKASPIYQSKPGDEGYTTRLMGSLVTLGVDVQDAANTAARVTSRGTAKNLIEAQAQALKSLATSRKTKRPSKFGPEPELEPADRFDGEVKDYRRAYAHAAVSGRTPGEMLMALGLAPELGELFAI